MLTKPLVILTIIQLLFCSLLIQAQDYNKPPSALTAAKRPLSFDLRQRQSDLLLFTSSEKILSKDKLKMIFQSELWTEFVQAKQQAQVDGDDQNRHHKKERRMNNDELMNDYERTAARLIGLEQWQYVAFAAACTERVALIVRSFGSPESQALYEQGLELVWLGVTRKDLAAQATQLIEKIEDAPEVDLDASGNTAYVGRSLYIMKYALEAVVRGGIDPALGACSCGMDFKSELDDLFIDESQRWRRRPSGEWPPLGDLQISEIKHQRQNIELIKSAQEPNADLINSLRRLSQDANQELEAAVSEIRRVEHE